MPYVSNEVISPLERHVVRKREVRREVANAYLDQTRQRLVLEPRRLWKDSSGGVCTIEPLSGPSA
jgi:hypothetical protein